MSLLYKEEKDIIYEASIDERKQHEVINITFWSDSGKFGAHEMLDQYLLTPLELLNILQKHNK